MPEKPKTEQEEVDDKRDRSASGETEKRRGYYYDDAHGYETFDPESAENGDEDDEEQADVC